MKVFLNSTLAYEYVIELMNYRKENAFIIQEMYNMMKRTIGDFKWAYKDMLLLKVDPIYSTMSMWATLDLDVNLKNKILMFWSDLPKVKEKIRSRVDKSVWNHQIEQILKANKDEIMASIDRLRNILWNLKGRNIDLEICENDLKYRYMWLAYEKKELNLKQTWNDYKNKNKEYQKKFNKYFRNNTP